jgi:ribose-phosphate pyrophosphokinase
MPENSDITILSDDLLKDKVADFVLLTGTSNLPLAEKVGQLLGKKVHKPVTQFADGERRVQIPVNIRRGSVVIIQPTCPPDIDGAIMELLLMIDAAKRASAQEIIVMIPYFGYARQDRKDRPRVPVSASLIANLLQVAGADKICTLDIHSDQSQGFVRIPWDNLFGSFTMVPRLEKEKFTNLVVASPDKGGVPIATAYARRLNAEGVAIVYKERDVHAVNQSEALDLIGNVSGKTVLLVDDMIDTARTLVNAANLLKEKGAKSIWAAATHGVLSADAIERINSSNIEKVIITDSIPQPEAVMNNPKFEIISVADLIAAAIQRIESGESISEKLIIR